MPIMMSMRKEYLDLVRSGDKRIEFRKRWNPIYKGLVFIYESGPESRHKVVAMFRTEGATKYEPHKGITDAVYECSRKTRYTTFDVECIESKKEPVWLVPIIDFVEARVDMTLQEFSDKYRLDPPLVTPPQSWTYIKQKQQTKATKRRQK